MVDKRSQQIQQMFSSVAHRYDLLNRLLSLSIDRLWRRYTRKVLAEALDHQSIVLDLCTGTGDLAIELARICPVLGLDFCRPMLEKGALKIDSEPVDFVEGDALNVPFPENRFDAVSIAFGLRNLESLEKGLSEMSRILKPDGTLAILEFSVPGNRIIRFFYLFYFTRILPFVGNLVSRKSGPYSYLPASVREFPSPEKLGRLIEESGFSRIEHRPLTAGIATLTVARKNTPH